MGSPDPASEEGASWNQVHKRLGDTQTQGPSAQGLGADSVAGPGRQSFSDIEGGSPVRPTWSLL